MVYFRDASRIVSDTGFFLRENTLKLQTSSKVSVRYWCISVARSHVVLSESLSIWNCTAMLLHVVSWIFGQCMLPLGTLAQWMPFC